jgi:hypothetical protein
MTTKIESTIGIRTLTHSDGRRITVKLGLPVPEDDGTYRCSYEIEGLGPNRVKYALGADGIQALYLTLMKIGTDLYTSLEGRRREITWEGSANLGFPVPESISDLQPK